MPKYQITPMIDGAVLLDILPDDHKADTIHKFFDPLDDDEPIAQAMRCAERYEADIYTS